MKNVVIIGGGLTGLTIAYLLKRQGKDFVLLEKENRVGGAIRTYHRDGFIYEAGPNTGVVSYPEVAELFEMLNLEIETAKESAEKRLILKNGKWYPLPHGAVSFIKTPLFTSSDKIKIFFEPLRKKGDNPYETVAELAERRIGKSFVDYAVNPFISGIYAGDPKKLVTKYALPKLYNLEQQYGSFIGGSFKKGWEKKTERDRKATRKVFSVKGGLEVLIKSLENNVGKSNIVCNAGNIVINKNKNNTYKVLYSNDDDRYEIDANHVISTVGSYSLSSLIPFLAQKDLDDLINLNYAKIVQVAVAVDEGTLDDKFKSFGGLIPQKECRNLLGILFPSYCFEGRAPDRCSVLAIYLGGIRHPELFDLTDKQINDLVCQELSSLLNISKESILFMEIFRHPYAIPQYEKMSGERFKTIEKIEKENKGLIIAGNLRNGIGMADRIRQAFEVARLLSVD